MSSPCATDAGRKIDISYITRLGVRAPDLPLVGIVVEAVDIVVEVGDQSVTRNGSPSGGRQNFVELFGGEVELIHSVGGAVVGLGPQFPVNVRMQGVDHGEPLVIDLPIGRQVGGDLSGLRVELGDHGLLHHRLPDVSILIHRDYEATGRKAGLRHGDRI